MKIIMTLLCVASLVLRQSTVRSFTFMRPSLPFQSLDVRSFATNRHNNAQRKRRSVASSLKGSSRNANNDKRATSAARQGPSLYKKKDPHLFRADRVLSNRGYGSRSECHKVLLARRVRIVEEEGDKSRLVTAPSERIGMNVRMFVDDTEIPTVPLLLVYHKPKWVLSVMKDPQGRPNLSNVLPPLYQNQPDLHPVGRLDYDTSGLLLFSSSGPLTQRLLHPNFAVDKEYVAIVEGSVDSDALEEQLTKGVKTTEGNHTAVLKRATALKPEHVTRVEANIRANLPSEYDETDLEERGYLPKKPIEHMTQVRIVVQEGKHRMVRRMLANCGHPVLELRRDRQGAVKLGKLPQGQFRTLTEDEQEWAEGLLPAKTKKK